MMRSMGGAAWASGALKKVLNAIKRLAAHRTAADDACEPHVDRSGAASVVAAGSVGRSQSIKRPNRAATRVHGRCAAVAPGRTAEFSADVRSPCIVAFLAVFQAAFLVELRSFQLSVCYAIAFGL
ncbi:MULTISPECIES: hypothetical protein [unclassified Paraburkholderia]|uniref:hypothetical protein n=1 Tax=unclassified Paraburkholderia TaxID=2615204 RepID=UPI002AB12067|nr:MULTISPECIES: hypothetical protein [unclassified Paraburkholderia]